MNCPLNPPHEISFVDIPADPSVGFGRNESGELQYRVIDIMFYLVEQSPLLLYELPDTLSILQSQESLMFGIVIVMRTSRARG